VKKIQTNHQHPHTNTTFSQARCPTGHPTNSVKALNVTQHSFNIPFPEQPW